MTRTPWSWGRSDDGFDPRRVLAYDSEFVRERHYYPKLSLVQIADGSGQARLYDATQPGHERAPPWDALLHHPAPLIMHAGSQDLEMIHLYGHQLPRSIRDTQLGFAFLSPERTISLSALIQHYLNFTPNKSQTRSDWLQRPLDEAQLDYAANDVGLLLRIYPLLVADLQQAGRLAWWAEECARLLQQDESDETPFAWYHLRFAPQLKGQAIIIADILTRAREAVAQACDKPRRTILPDKVLLDLALADIDSIEALAEWLPAEHPLWHALPQLDHAFSNLSSYSPEPIPRTQRLNMLQQKFCQRLQKAVYKLASELNVHPNLIISPRKLRQWCSENRYDRGLLREGWRGECLNRVIDVLAP